MGYVSLPEGTYQLCCLMFQNLRRGTASVSNPQVETNNGMV